MALKTVKYKLTFDPKVKGFVTPPGISNGGEVFSTSSNVADMIFIGKYDIQKKSEIPSFIVEVVQDKVLKLQRASKKSSDLEKYKKDRYASECDPLFAEALRDKLTKNDDTKWKQYLDKVESIHSLTSIPKQ